MNVPFDWKMFVLWFQIVQDILSQFPMAQMEEPTHQGPRGAELLFCFDVAGPT